MKQTVRFNLNRVPQEAVVDPHQTLLDVLRNQFDLTGTKPSCDGTGECGACTVILDGKAVYSCLVLAVETEGKSIVTVEGLSVGGKLHPLQEAFVKHGAIQCGYCTPGMLLAAKAYLDQNSNPTEREVREAIAGNLCRCTGYYKVIEAIMDVASGRHGGRAE